jgi:glycerophosphoryl diester phosphodiesterase
MQPALMAHRGNSGLAPENTLAAFALALDTKAEWIELDVHLSADGEVVVTHDPTVDRCTNGTGAIAEMTLAELRALDAGSWFGPEFAGKTVPTLAEVVALVGDRLRLNVEIKSAADPLSSLKVVQVLADGAVLAQSMISSFSLEAILETRKHWPEGRLALITDRAADLEIALEHNLPWLNIAYPEVDEALVRRAHEAAIKVMIWTMDDPARWAYFAGLGVDIVCTNVPHLMPV